MMDYSRKVAVLVVIDLDEDVSRLYAFHLCNMSLAKVKRSRGEDVRELLYFLFFRV